MEYPRALNNSPLQRRRCAIVVFITVCLGKLANQKPGTAALSGACRHGAGQRRVVQQERRRAQATCWSSLSASMAPTQGEWTIIKIQQPQRFESLQFVTAPTTRETDRDTASLLGVCFVQSAHPVPAISRDFPRPAIAVARSLFSQLPTEVLSSERPDVNANLCPLHHRSPHTRRFFCTHSSVGPPLGKDSNNKIETSSPVSSYLHGTAPNSGRNTHATYRRGDTPSPTSTREQHYHRPRRS